MAPVGQLGEADASLILAEGGVGGGGNGERKKLGRTREKKKLLLSSFSGASWQRT